VVCGTYWGEERCIQDLMGKHDGERLLEDIGIVEGKYKMYIQKYESACTGLIGPRIGICGELLWIW